MKTEITAKDYKDIYEACGWDAKAFSIVLKRLGYSDKLIVKGHLDLINSPIKSLVGVKEVRGYLDLENTPIQDLGNLEEVGGWLGLTGTPMSKKYSEEEIRRKVMVGGYIFL